MERGAKRKDKPDGMTVMRETCGDSGRERCGNASAGAEGTLKHPSIFTMDGCFLLQKWVVLLSVPGSAKTAVAIAEKAKQMFNFRGGMKLLLHFRDGVDKP